MKGSDLLKIKEGYKAETIIRNEATQRIIFIAEKVKGDQNAEFSKEKLPRLATAAANVFIWLVRKDKVSEASDELLELLFREQIVIDRTSELDERKANAYFFKLEPLLIKMVERRAGIRDKEIVEDIVQETNKRFFSNIKTKGVELTTRLEGYLYGIAKNVIHEQRREFGKISKTEEYNSEKFSHNHTQKSSSNSDSTSDNEIDYLFKVNHIVAKHFRELPEKCQKSFLLGYGWDADKVEELANKQRLNQEERLTWIKSMEVSSDTNKPMSYQQYYKEVKAKNANAAKTAHSRCLNLLSNKAIPELIKVMEGSKISWKSLEKELKSRLKKIKKG